MLVLKLTLFLVSAGAVLAGLLIVLNDLGFLARWRKPDDGPEGGPEMPESGTGELRWRLVLRCAALGIVPLLIALSISVVPSGSAGIVVSQISGTQPETLYPGTHWNVPFLQSTVIYDIRDRVYQTLANVADPKAPEPEDLLRLQTKEGLTIGLAAAVRYRVDPQRLSFVHSTLPQPYDQEIVPTAVASAFREVIPNYTTREAFSVKREEIRRTVAERLTRKLAADGILVKEVLVRDVALPPEYAKGMEGLLLKEQENERLSIEIQVKEKNVRAVELEAEAEKARLVKEAEAEAAARVLEAKAEADAMEYTLPLKEKQIQQSRLEAEARKEATLKNAEAAAQAKVVDSRAELERRKLLAEADAHRTRLMAGADAEKMQREATVLKENPLLIQKIIAERLSDKVQIMMVPTDGKFFFANDVLRSGQMVSLGGGREQ